MGPYNKAVTLEWVADYAEAVRLYDKAIMIREQLVNREGRVEVRDGLQRAQLRRERAERLRGPD